MAAQVIMCIAFIYYLVALIIADPLNFNPNWASRRLLNNTTIEPEKSIFDKIKEFYDDPNNLAMYGVLPIIVLVYGGFCVIYCACKGYNDCKKKKNKKKKKQLLEDDDDEVVTANSSGEYNNNTKNENGDMRHHPDPRAATRAAMVATSVKQQQNVRKHTTSTSDVKLAVERENSTPLPWAVPDEDTLYPTKEKGHQLPPAASEPKPIIKPYKPPNRKPHPDMHMPPSPPPPYDDYGRRDSVEEISMNPRKLNALSNRSNDPRKAMNAMEQYHLARQAAQLLRVENGHPGQPGYKKPKRLVFVAE